MARKSCITHHILPIFSCTNRFSFFQELRESFNGTNAYFKRRGGNEDSFFFESKLAKFYEEVIRKLMARWEDVVNKNDPSAFSILRRKKEIEMVRSTIMIKNPTHPGMRDTSPPKVPVAADNVALSNPARNGPSSSKINWSPISSSQGTSGPSAETQPYSSARSTVSGTSGSISSRQICVARFTYKASQPDELTIKPGDRICVLDKSSDGWWHGMLLPPDGDGSIDPSGQKSETVGWFPSNYVGMEQTPNKFLPYFALINIQILCKSIHPFLIYLCQLKETRNPKTRLAKRYPTPILGRGEEPSNKKFTFCRPYLDQADNVFTFICADDACVGRYATDLNVYPFRQEETFIPVCTDSVDVIFSPPFDILHCGLRLAFVNAHWPNSSFFTPSLPCCYRRTRTSPLLSPLSSLLSRASTVPSKKGHKR
ncbi:hypothetical protein ACTXT7_008702 [Hymenolepis weldensis]